jgi:predicted alpha/beta-fold hydrolase
MKAGILNFKPPAGLRSPHVQSLLNSSWLRRRGVSRRALALRDAEQEMTLDGGSGIRLQGFYSPAPSGRGVPERGLAVLLHGWEGSVNSNYMLANGARLYDEGFDVFRLNFRDHGDTHHLNPGIFHSCRLDEVINALGDMQRQLRVNDWNIAGYSLGGNFSLRVALNAPGAGLNIRQVVGICPVVDPAGAMRAMEEGIRFYERYFERKWSRSLSIKKESFPELYGEDNWHELRGLRARTHYLATRYAGFESADKYFEGYSIAGKRLEALKVPATVLTSADDPVVPARDFEELVRNPGLEVLIAPYGGHCGFFKNWKLESLAEDLVVERFLRVPRTRPGPQHESTDHD